jgi:hypothetical protein
MIVSPHLALEHPLVASQLEGAGGVRLDPAVPQQHDSGGQVPHVGRDVRRKQQGASVFSEPLRTREQQPGCRWIEVRRRFVEEIHIDGRQKGNGHGEPLAFPARQVPDAACGEPFELAGANFAVDCGGIEASELCNHAECLAHRQRRRKDRFLRQVTHAAAGTDWIGGEIVSGDRDRSAVRVRQARNAAQRRRLARAVRAKQRDALPRRDFQVDAVENPAAAERLGDAGQREHGPVSEERRNNG